MSNHMVKDNERFFGYAHTSTITSKVIDVKCFENLLACSLSMYCVQYLVNVKLVNPMFTM